VTEPAVRVTDLVKRYGEPEALCTLANPTPGSVRVAG
jgi:hypothetical protein